MKSTMRMYKKLATLSVVGALSFALGCNPGSALRLQDWARDLLSLGSGSLSAAVVAANLQAQIQTLAEQIANQGTQGAQGAQGLPGVDGVDGQDGTDGVNGVDGTDGVDGVDGQDGEPGPALFNTFIDELYTLLPNYEVSSDPTPTFLYPLGWKTAIPSRYDAGNPVTMRMYIAYDGTIGCECPLFKMSVVRLAHGSTAELVLLDQIVRLEVPNCGDLVVTDTQPVDDPIFIVVDIPLNTADGLNIVPDLAAGQLLSFGMEWYDVECTSGGNAFELYGVEFFESEVDDTTVMLQSATLPAEAPMCICGSEYDNEI